MIPLITFTITDTIVSGIVIQITILIIGFIGLNRKSYNLEKGKNLATKEDIGEITKTIESIKTDFIRETEQIKTDLQFDHQVKLSFYNDRKNAVTNLYECYSVWYHNLSESFFYSLELKVDDFEKTLLEINKLYLLFLRAESKVELYIEDEDLLIIIDELDKLTNNLQAELELYFDRICFALKQESEVIAKFGLDAEETKTKQNIIQTYIQNEFKSYTEKTKELESAISNKTFDYCELARSILLDNLEIIE